MKSTLNKIIFSFCIVISITSCHNFEHQKIVVQKINKSSNEELFDNKDESSKFTIKKSMDNSEMAPIDIPKQTEIVKKLALQKKIKIPNDNNFSLNKFVNWNEERLIKKLGNSHFIKEEGKLKNYQYHLKECFLHIFLLKKNNVYSVSYIETRPTNLNGTINIKACIEEIKQNLN